MKYCDRNFATKITFVFREIVTHILSRNFADEYREISPSLFAKYRGISRNYCYEISRNKKIDFRIYPS
jgi:hypothetical protein